MEEQISDFNSDEQISENKSRHGCVTAWLIFMIIANSFMALIYFFFSELVIQNSPVAISTTMILLLGFIGLLNAVFAVFLLKWKKWAFWGFAGTAVLTLVINLTIGLGVGSALAGLIGIAILYGILQIKSNDVSAWKNLE
jgi:membrane protein YdbS with pleckstrin-like domain